jgi:hypothetical protein
MSFSTQTMRAVLVRDGKSDAGALCLGDAPRPAPGPGQVLVKIRAFGLNRMDIMQRNGAYPGACSPCKVGESGGAGGAQCRRARTRSSASSLRGLSRRGGEGSARGAWALEAGRRCLQARVRRACPPSSPLNVVWSQQEACVRKSCRDETDNRSDRARPHSHHDLLRTRYARLLFISLPLPLPRSISITTGHQERYRAAGVTTDHSRTPRAPKRV